MAGTHSSMYDLLFVSRCVYLLQVKVLLFVNYSRETFLFCKSLISSPVKMKMASCRHWFWCTCDCAKQKMAEYPRLTTLYLHSMYHSFLKRKMLYWKNCNFKIIEKNQYLEYCKISLSTNMHVIK